MSNQTPIRVTGTFTPSGTQDVNIVSPIPVPVVQDPVTPLAVGGVTNVGANVLTTIVTFTAVAATNITRIGVSGSDYGKFQLFLNTILIETRRTSPNRSTDFLFTSPLSLAPSDILDVKVTQYATGVLADFEATVYGA